MEVKSARTGSSRQFHRDRLSMSPFTVTWSLLLCGSLRPKKLQSTKRAAVTRVLKSQNTAVDTTMMPAM